MADTDTTDVGRSLLEDSQGTRPAGLLDMLTGSMSKDPSTGDVKIDYPTLLMALLGGSTNAAKAGDTGGGQTLGATTPEGAGYTPVHPTTGEETSRPAPKEGKTQAYPGGAAFVQGMIQRGWTPEEAAGAAGNVHVESGFKPAVKSSVTGEQSYGFMQWNKDRLQGLKNMAADRGLDWRSPEAQMDWMAMERSGESVKYGGTNEAAAYARAFSGGGDAAQIAARFGQFVERPKDLSQSVKERMAAATQYASTAGKGVSETQYASAPKAPVDYSNHPAVQQVMNKVAPFGDGSTHEEELLAAILGGKTPWA